MADEPTIEEAKAILSKHLDWLTNEQHEWALTEGEISRREALRTLLVSHASLEERVEEAKMLMKPFAAHSDDDPDPQRTKRMAFLPIGDLRALAAFVNEKET